MTLTYNYQIAKYFGDPLKKLITNKVECQFSLPFHMYKVIRIQTMNYEHENSTPFRHYTPLYTLQ